MKTIANEQIVFCDADDTLILHDVAKYPKLPKLLVYDPYMHCMQLVAIHLPHVQLIRERAARGAHIVVWSAGGYKWAKAVVLALGLEDCVAACMSKPIMMLDDLPVKKALGSTLYLNPNSAWKQQRSKLHGA